MTQVTPLPQSAHFIEGVINLRGEVIPVGDLSKRFELDPGERGGADQDYNRGDPGEQGGADRGFGYRSAPSFLCSDTAPLRSSGNTLIT